MTLSQAGNRTLLFSGRLAPDCAVALEEADPHRQAGSPSRQTNARRFLNDSGCKSFILSFILSFTFLACGCRRWFEIVLTRFMKAASWPVDLLQCSGTVRRNHAICEPALSSACPYAQKDRCAPERERGGFVSVLARDRTLVERENARFHAAYAKARLTTLGQGDAPERR